MTVFERYLTIQEILLEHGYTTVAISSSPVVKVTPPVLGGGRGYGQGFHVFEEVAYPNDRSPENVIERASKTLRNIRGVDVVGWTGRVDNGRIVEYRANVKISFIVEQLNE